MAAHGVMWALEDRNLDATDKLILISLANFTTIDGVAIMPIRVLAGFASMGPRSLRIRLKRLEDRGYIRTTRRYSEAGSIPNQYALLRVPRVSYGTGGGVASDRGGVSPATGGGGARSTPCQHAQNGATRPGAPACNGRATPGSGGRGGVTQRGLLPPSSEGDSTCTDPKSGSVCLSDSSTSTHPPESGVQSTSTRTNLGQETAARRRAAPYSAAFERCYQRHGRRTEKLAAWKEWQRVGAEQPGGEVTAAEIERAIEDQLTWPSGMALNTEARYRPSFRRWLHNRRWEDERPAAAPKRDKTGLRIAPSKPAPPPDPTKSRRQQVYDAYWGEA